MKRLAQPAEERFFHLRQCRSVDHRKPITFEVKHPMSQQYLDQHDRWPDSFKYSQGGDHSGKEMAGGKRVPERPLQAMIAGRLVHGVERERSFLRGRHLAALGG